MKSASSQQAPDAIAEVEAALERRGFEILDHHDHLGAHHPDAGLIIDVRTIDPVRQRMHNHDHPIRMDVSYDQRAIFDGVFDTELAAGRRALTVVDRHLEDSSAAVPPEAAESRTLQ